MHVTAIDTSARPNLSYRYNQATHLREIRNEMGSRGATVPTDDSVYRHQNRVRAELVKRGLREPARRRPRQ